jgi:hypothetical protein
LARDLLMLKLPLKLMLLTSMVTEMDFQLMLLMNMVIPPMVLIGTISMEKGLLMLSLKPMASTDMATQLMDMDMVMDVDNFMDKHLFLKISGQFFTLV